MFSDHQRYLPGPVRAGPDPLRVPGPLQRREVLRRDIWGLYVHSVPSETHSSHGFLLFGTGVPSTGIERGDGDSSRGSVDTPVMGHVLWSTSLATFQSSEDGPCLDPCVLSRPDPSVPVPSRSCTGGTPPPGMCGRVGTPAPATVSSRSSGTVPPKGGEEGSRHHATSTVDKDVHTVLSLRISRGLGPYAHRSHPPSTLTGTTPVPLRSPRVARNSVWSTPRPREVTPILSAGVSPESGSSRP